MDAHRSTLRLACPDDAGSILEIYTPVVLNTAISFEFEPPTLEEMRGRIAWTLARYPWLVVEQGGCVLGYAYAGPHRDRAAYQWSVGVSVYVRDGNRRAGLGRILYTALLAQLRLMGFYTAYAGIALPNPSSVRLHESLGFERLVVYSRVGFKLGAWHDVGWWRRELRAATDCPAPPLPIAAARCHPEWAASLAFDEA